MNDKKKRGSLIRQSGPGAIWQWPIVLIWVIYVIYMAHRIGLKGMTYMSGPLCLYLILSRGICNTTAEVIRRRVGFYRSRDAFLSANKSYRFILLSVTLFSVAVAALLFIFSDQISRFLFSTVLGSLSLKILAIALVLRVITSCMCAYLDGMGALFPTLASDFLPAPVALLVAFLCSGKVAAYAQKMGDLMRSETYYYAYLAVLFGGSILAGVLVTFLVIIILKAALMKRLHKMYDGGATKTGKRASQMAYDLFVSAGAMLLKETYVYVILFVVLVRAMTMEDTTGELPGIVLCSGFLLYYPGILLQKQLSAVLAKMLTRELKRGDKPAARERVAICMKVLMYVAVPYLTLLLTETGAVAGALFDSQNEVLLRFLRLGIWSSLMVTLLLLLNEAISVIKSRAYANLLLLLGWIGGGLFCFLAQKKDGMSPDNMMLSALSFSSLILLLLEGYILWKSMKYKEDLLRIFVLIPVSGVVYGLICLVAQRFLAPAAGDVAALAFGIVFGSLVYVTCIVMTHTFDGFELSQVPVRGFPVGVARWLKLY